MGKTLMKLGLVGLVGLGLSGCMTSDGSIATSGKIEKETIDKIMYSLFEPYNHFEEQFNETSPEWIEHQARFYNHLKETHPEWSDELVKGIVYGYEEN